MESFNITTFLDKIQDKHFIIDASAGTGKTHSIVQMVCELVGKTDTKLENILVVTYTEKAAGELKKKIRDELKTTDVDNAPIGTIHSFCNNVIKEYNLYVKHPFQLTLVDDTFIEEKFNETIRKCVYENKFPEEDDNTIENDFEKVKAIISKGYFDDEGNIDSSIVEYSKKTELLIKFYSEFNELFDKNEIVDINDVKKCFNDTFSGIIDIESENSDFYKDIVKTSLNNKNISFNGKTYDDKFFEEHSNLKIIKEICKDIDTNDFDAKPFPRLKILVQEVYKRWQEEKRKNKWQTYNDMLRVVREIVKSDSGALLNKLREKYKYVIIDEFQDTNQIQWDIFKKLFLESDNNRIVVVGDKKQSIYSFMGADVFVYEQAKEDIRKTGQYVECCLSVNYRSNDSMVQAYNKLFLESDFKNAFEYNEVSSYSNIKQPIYIENSGNEIPTNGLLIIDQKDDNKNNVLINYANHCVKLIIDYCSLSNFDNKKTKLQKWMSKDEKYENVSFKDFAILYRTRSEAEHIEYALKEAGIPYIKYKDDSLLNGLEKEHWVALLQALIAPDFTGYNRNIFKKALFTRFFGYDIKTISNSMFEKDDIEEMEWLLKWKDYLKDKKYAELIDSIFEDSKIENSMGSLQDIQSLTIFKQIGDLILEKFYQGYTVEDIIDYLNNSGGEDDEGENESVVRKGTDFDCVKLMTIHASKGLQFPIVISVAGWKQEIKDKIFQFHNEDKRFISFYKENKKIEEEKDQEFIRLFYVAFTRAENILIIPNYGKYYFKNFLKNTISSYINKYHADATILKYEWLPGKIKIDQFDKDAVKKILSNNLDDENKVVQFILSKSPVDENDKNTIKEILLSYKITDENKEVITKILSKTSIDVVDKEKILKILKQCQDNHKEIIIKKIANSVFKHKIYKHSYSTLSHDKKEDDIIYEGLLDVDKEKSIVDVDLSDYDSKDSQKVIIKCDYTNSTLKDEDIPANFPKGSSVGTTLHEILAEIDFKNLDDSELNKIIKERFINNKMIFDDDIQTYVRNMLKNVLSAKFPKIRGASQVEGHFQLKDFELLSKKAEIEFNFDMISENDDEKNKMRNYCNGFIDLVIKHPDGYYSILDWKSDSINQEDLISYNNLEDLKKRVDKYYSIQRVLYSYCLIKWLHNFYQEDYEKIFNEHFGGIYYVFIRGCEIDSSNGIYAQTWKSWKDLEEAFNYIVDNKIKRS